jgi:hypothetical protein
VVVGRLWSPWDAPRKKSEAVFGGFSQNFTVSLPFLYQFWKFSNGKVLGRMQMTK